MGLFLRRKKLSGHLYSILKVLGIIPEEEDRAAGGVAENQGEEVVRQETEDQHSMVNDPGKADYESPRESLKMTLKIPQERRSKREVKAPQKLTYDKMGKPEVKEVSVHKQNHIPVQCREQTPPYHQSKPSPEARQSKQPPLNHQDKTHVSNTQLCHQPDHKGMEKETNIYGQQYPSTSYLLHYDQPISSLSYKPNSYSSIHPLSYQPLLSGPIYWV